VSKFHGPTRWATRVVWYGDSYCQEVNPGADFPRLTMVGLDAGFNRVGFNGLGWGLLLSGGYQTELTKTAIGTTTNILVMSGGHGDFTFGADGETTYDRAVTAAEAAVAAGFDAVVITTMSPTLETVTDDQETDREEYNTLLLANGDDAFDAVIDLAGDSRLDDYTDTTYYDADETHYNPAGSLVAADLTRPDIAALIP
jgi:hypothetical protein